MSRASRAMAKQVLAALRHVDRLHPSPLEADDDDWDWLADVDELQATIAGGFERGGVTTTSMHEGLRIIREIRSAQADRMSVQQRTALERLAAALGGA